ncbi:MAG: nitronate monooxygenase [Alphaproteobacteria bacterium]|nr:nitronate monooxygenase [Alphaproteobacteria bacterium]
MPHATPFGPMRLPICAAPMFLVSGPDLVLAACRAGIMGSFPTPNVRKIEELDAWMASITAGLAAARAADPAALIGPWAVNLVTHSSNNRLGEDLALVAKYRPPVVITALGSPRPAIETVHGYGGKVVADVISLPLARKALAAGADGLACVSAGAGGHTGFLSPFAFIATIREMFDGPVIVGGGIADGAGVAGSIAAGADLVYVGTAFIPASESIAPEAHKQMVVDASIDDLLVTSAISGTPASWLKPSLVQAGIDPADLGTPHERKYDSNAALPKRWLELFAAGQGVGASRAIEPVEAIVARMERGYAAAVRRLAGLSIVY